MTLSRSYIRNAVTTPLDARLMNMAGIVANADGSPRVGVIGNGGSIVTATGTMNVAIAAAEFATSKGRSDGVAIFANDGVVNVLIGAAPVSNSRIDVIWVKHNDDTTGDADALPTFGVTAGTAAASPTKPAIGMTGALELATIRIYSGTTATNGGTNLVTNTYNMTAARGGIVPFRTKADLDLWTTASSGQAAVNLATGDAYLWNGSAWLILAPLSFIPVTATAVGPGTVTAGTMAALTGIACSVSVVAAIATRARISLTFNYSGAAVGTGAVLGVKGTGATTITPLVTSPGTVKAVAPVAGHENTYAGVAIVSLNAGSTTLDVVGQIIGSGGARNVSNIVLIAEPIEG